MNNEFDINCWLDTVSDDELSLFEDTEIETRVTASFSDHFDVNQYNEEL